MAGSKFKIQELIDKLGGVMAKAGADLPASGAYALLIEIARKLKIKTGAHGRAELDAGLYLYAGRASRGLPQRVARHCRRAKSVRWHIDHITSRQGTRVLEILIFAGRPGLECEIIRASLRQGPARIPLAHFGSSDCAEGCPAHLVLLEG